MVAETFSWREIVGHDDLGHGTRVRHHPALIVLELRLQRLLEGNRLARDRMHQRPALRARKNQ